MMLTPVNKEGKPIFTRGLEAMPALPDRPSLSFGKAVPVFLGLVCVSLLFMSRSDEAQQRPNLAKKASAASKVNSGSENTGSNSTEPAVRRSADFYTSGVRGSLFSAPQHPISKPVVVKKAPIRPAQKAIVPTVPILHINPFADYSYTGTVNMNGTLTALIENSKTKEGQYVHVGEMFMGAQVASVTEQMVTLVTASAPVMLAKSDTLNVVPLTQSAPYMTNGAQPQANPQNNNGQPPPGPPQAMQQMPDASAANANFSITLPNGRVLTGQRAMRYQQRLNRNFNQ